MLKLIDDFLNKTTMYRLILYYLSALWTIALLMSIFGILPYSPVMMILSAAIIIAACWITNEIFARTFKAPTNVESLYITAFILALIITPMSASDWQTTLPFIIWASIFAMASKYILAIGRKHIFNPAAFAVALMAFTIDQSASWWVGSSQMILFTILGGILIAKKIRRWELVLSFLGFALAAILISGMLRGSNGFTTLAKAFGESPILFFAFVMITEPLTTPPKRKSRIIYGALTGFLFAPAIHFGAIYSTPELALLAGNIFSYFASPKQKLALRLKEKIKMAGGVFDFVFQPADKITFEPGQYMEWTFPHNKPDSRGNRRYFTLASSPTENEIRLGVKFYDEPSSFKRKLFQMNGEDEIIASQLAGDFVMPKDPSQKLAFIAGGIGITPFRSMIKYLLDKNRKRDAVLLYSNKTADEIAYKDIFDEAKNRLGIKTIYALTEEAPVGWLGYNRPFNAEIIKKEISDFAERIFYLSGPHGMVSAFEKTLREMNVPNSNIKTDFFPGLA